MKSSLQYTLIAFCFFYFTSAQNPGLIISEVLANPNGTDSCKEYVELRASQAINFSLTPYSIIVNNNGAATNLGWKASGALTYAFEINTGSVAVGDVVYVGGSCMTPSTNILRAINVKYVNGDANLGLANASGVFGNGGSNADGVAVFNLPVTAIQPSTPPVDAVFFGTGVGTASVNLGIDGYQLPVNDLYNGGKFTTGSFFGPDPGSDIILTLNGTFQLSNASWLVNRTISTGTVHTLGSSGIQLVTTGTVSPGTVAFVSNDTTVAESQSIANIYVKLTATSSFSSSINVYATAFSNATATDYTLAATTVTFAANAPINTSFPITFSLNNDNTIESAEYIILRFYNPQNINIGTIRQHAFYIKDDDKPIPQASNSLSLNLLSSFSNSVSGSNSAEIVAHDPSTQRLYIANSIGGKIDIVNFINPSNPILLNSVPITTYGNINSIAVKNGTVAAAIEGTNPQDSGSVVFFNASGNFLKQVKVGMMPDMITFNQAGNKVLTANEGEPNTAYTVDPDGSISIIDLSPGVSNITQSNVSHITFTAYNGQEPALRAQGIRIFGLNATTSKDFEPEYIAVSKDDTKAWVTLQENNAVVEINLASNNFSINAIRALGSKNHMSLDLGMDISNTTQGINISNFPVKGLFMPDAIATYTVGGINYIITANEGDSRAYAGFSEEVRIASANLDPVRFPFKDQMQNNSVMGRLYITNKLGDSDNDGDLDTLYSWGGRSFSIWNAQTGQLVYDSKDDMEQITASNSYSTMFNASNTTLVKKDRSDDKGPEPEGVTIGRIGNNDYAFIAVERIGGVMVYDVTNPQTPVFVCYVNNRSLQSNGPDRGAEGIIFIPQQQSPNGQHLVIAANEVSSTLSIWGIPGCSNPLNSAVSVSGNTTQPCQSNPPVYSVANTNSVTYQWYLNGNAVLGATASTFAPVNSGALYVHINAGLNCSVQSLPNTLTLIPSPTIAINGPTLNCIGGVISLTASGASTYTWTGMGTSSSQTVSPAITTIYTVNGTTNGCTGTASTVIQAVLPPLISVVGSASACSGQAMVLNAQGAQSYTWNGTQPGTQFTITPIAPVQLTLSGTSVWGCNASITHYIGIAPQPTIVVSPLSATVCSGQLLVLNASGAQTYTWNSGLQNAPLNWIATGTSTVIQVNGKNEWGCQSAANASISVEPCTLIKTLVTDGWNVFPNPTQNTIQIDGITNQANIKIYSMSGKLQMHFIAVPQSVYSIEALDAGVYTLIIESEELQKSTKLIKL